MSVHEAASNTANAVTYVIGAAFFIVLGAVNGAREQYHNYRRWPGL